MMKPFVYLLLLILFLLGFQRAEKVQYFSIEHVTVSYVNPKYVSYANATARRHARKDPLYYADIFIISKVTIGNNFTANIYFYEWLSNVYKRSFVEMHFPLCEMIHNNLFLGVTMKQGKFAQPCPYPPGEYGLYNMTIPSKRVPANFPFRKGRIYLNLTRTETNEDVMSVHGDMELKDYTDRKVKNN